MRPYKYAALGENEIRLASLHPLSSGAPLSINIQHISDFSAGEPYEALSYVWGGAENTYSLYCKNGTNLLVTPNLQSALLALRLKDTPRLLWVDAICINQNDLTERNSQVSLMTLIYKAAKRTVVYLGDEADDSWLAATYLTRLFQRCCIGIATGIKKDIVDKKPRMEQAHQVARQIASSRKELFESFPPHATQKAIVHLLARPWFQRVWVIQEFAVSKKIQMLVGPNEIQSLSFLIAFCYVFPTAQLTWHELAEPSTLRGFHRGLSQMLQMQVLRQRIQSQEGRGRRRLMALLSTCRGAQATNGCDKIYALLGLSSDILSFFPDYAMSAAVAFTWFAAHCINRGQADGEGLLYEACVTDERNDGIPSWVPDWRSLPKCRNLGHSLTATNGRWFQAGKPSLAYYPPYLTLEEDCTKLLTKGILLDSLVILGPAQISDDGSELHLEHLLNVLTSMQTYKMTCGPYPTGEIVDKVLARILEVDQPRDEDNVTSLWEYHDARDIQLDMVIKTYDHTTTNYPLTLAEIRRLYREEPHGLRNAARAIAGRVFGITDQRYAGLFPSGTRYGDRICILQGFRVPFVLRKGGEGCWTLVGDAYVDGMMWGEMVGDGSSFKEIRIA